MRKRKAAERHWHMSPAFEHGGVQLTSVTAASNSHPSGGSLAGGLVTSVGLELRRARPRRPTKMVVSVFVFVVGPPEWWCLFCFCGDSHAERPSTSLYFALLRSNLLVGDVHFVCLFCLSFLFCASARAVRPPGDASWPPARLIPSNLLVTGTVPNWTPQNRRRTLTSQ